MATAKKKADAVPCSNCGAPAGYRTSGTAANVDHYCGQCADEVYPDGEGLEALE